MDSLSAEQARELSARLRARRPELEEAISARVFAVADPTRGDPEYREGVRSALTSALELFLTAVESGPAPDLPDALLNQARLAARHRVDLDVVLRRYLAGYSLLADFLVREAQEMNALDGAGLQGLIRLYGSLFDQVIAAISDAYTREARRRPDSAEERRTDFVKRLLAGELLDASGLGYELSGWHLGAVLMGEGASSAIKSLAAALDRRLLLVPMGNGTLSAWLGGRRRPARRALGDYLSTSWPPEVALALGHPCEGLSGWRLTHRQARATLQIVLRTRKPYAHYEDVALLASVMRDDTLSTSFRRIYLEPLAGERDGLLLIDTLRGYFGRERNLSATAAALAISRRTVANRLHRAEALIGRSLSEVATELEVALRLAELDDTFPP